MAEQRIAARMRSPAQLFSSLHLWDFCALIPHSRGYCGSSLHGRIVATAFALPRLSLLHPAQVHRATKQGAYITTWEIPGLPATVGIEDIAQGMQAALRAESQQLRLHAMELAAHYQKGFLSITKAVK